jgi:hypothetical protein
MNSQKINLKGFFHIAGKNFWKFFIISLLGGIYDIVIIITKYFLKVESIGWLHNIPVGNFLFFFSYCLVIMSYYSRSNLKPVRNSIGIVFIHSEEVRVVYLIMIINFLLGILEYNITPNGNLFIAPALLWTIVYAALNFYGIVYAYRKLSEVFFHDLQFDFSLCDKKAC